MKRCQALYSLLKNIYGESHWSGDNPGVLIDCNNIIDRILLCNDLTEPVIDEAVKGKFNTILSYHPVIWKPLSSLSGDPVKLIENKISVISIHTHTDREMNYIALCNILNIDYDISDFRSEKIVGGLLNKSSDALTVVMKHEVQLKYVIAQLKSFLNLDTIQVILPYNKSEKYEHVAFGAGYGNFKEDAFYLKIDCSENFELKNTIIITGEMNASVFNKMRKNNNCIILLGHCVSERWHLQYIKYELEKLKFDCTISTEDSSPIKFL